jgi:hypothetical protein
MTEWLDLIIVEEGQYVKTTEQQALRLTSGRTQKEANGNLVVIAKADIPSFEGCRMGKCRRGGVIEVHQVLLCGE